MKKIISFISVVSLVAITMLVLPANVGAVPVSLVTGVTLNESNHTLTVGDTDALTATVAPADATNKTVSYISSSTSVATVDASGLVTAVATGTAIITVTASDTTNGTFTATDDITVNTPIYTLGGSGLVSGSGGLTSYTPPSSGTLPTPPSNSNGTIPSFPNTGGDTLLPPPPAPAVLGAETFKFTEWMSITRGSHASEVPQLQQRLTTEGDYTGAIDGIFGKLTKASVKAYQSAHPPLKVDGIVGPLTRAVLNK